MVVQYVLSSAACVMKIHVSDNSKGLEGFPKLFFPSRPTFPLFFAYSLLFYSSPSRFYYSCQGCDCATTPGRSQAHDMGHSHESA